MLYSGRSVSGVVVGALLLGGDGAGCSVRGIGANEAVSVAGAVVGLRVEGAVLAGVVVRGDAEDGCTVIGE